MARLLGVFLTWCFTATVAAAAPPIDVLKSQYPALYKVYVANERYQAGLADYANRQGFRRPFENLATVIHEVIHIDSAVHQGYFIDGIYYEPYLRRDAWPGFTNELVGPYLASHERGIIYRLYALNSPHNHLGNLVDEINAYGHVMPFVCSNEPESSEKQIKNLVGFLHLTEGYLRVMRLAAPQEYSTMVENKESRGVFKLVIQRAWEALTFCGVPAANIPSQETGYFMAVTAQQNQAIK